MSRINDKSKVILWISVGAIGSLFVISPLIIALLKYEDLNHRKPFSEVFVSSYKYILVEIHPDNLILMFLFLSVGGVVGYWLYTLKTAQNTKEESLSVEALLKKGEGEAIEFKSSLRWDFRQRNVSKEIEFAVLKTIAAFMNTQRGTLLIGVADDAAIIGLECDYHTLKRKDRDGFEQYIMGLVALNIGANCCKNIRVKFFERQGKDICIIDVSHTKIPVFLKFHQNIIFYVRTGNHTRELDIQEALLYIKHRK